MKISKHAKLRYVERVLGIQESKAQRYLTQNKSSINDSIRKMVSDGKFCGTNRKNYAALYRYKDWMIVVEPVTNTVITIYRVTVKRQTVFSFKMGSWYGVKKRFEYI